MVRVNQKKQNKGRLYEQKIDIYNHAINAINSDLQMMGLYEHLLPVIDDVDEMVGVVNQEIVDNKIATNGVNKDEHQYLLDLG